VGDGGCGGAIAGFVEAHVRQYIASARRRPY